MDPFALPPLAALLDTAHSAVAGLAAGVEPLAGSASVALAVVLLTLLVRTALIPVGVSQVRADFARRRLAPRLAALSRRYRADPVVLREKTLALYREESVSPLAGVGPTLAQAPVMSLVYALFVNPIIAGHANVLLSASLLGAPLGSSFVSVVAASPALPVVAVFCAVLLCVVAAAWMTRRASQRFAAASSPPADERARAITAVLSWLPFATLVIAAVVPLAAAIYLAISTSWTVVERALLRRRFAPAA